MADYRKNEKELRYYASDLNKFIGTECDRNHTTNNVDCIQRRLQPNGETRIRFIESKHSNESMPPTQLATLMCLVEIANIVNEANRKIKVQVVMVAGDHPYESSVVHNLITDKEHTLNREQLKAFLEFRYNPFAP